MPVIVTCPNCSARGKAPDKLRGKRVKCSRCQTLINVSTFVPADDPPDEEPPDEPEPESERLPLPAASADEDPMRAVRPRRNYARILAGEVWGYRTGIARTALVVTCVLATIYALGCRFMTRDWWLIGHVSIIAAVASIGLFLRTIYPWRWIWLGPLTFAIAIGLVVLNHETATYTSHWENEEKVSFKDEYFRGAEFPFYRSASKLTDDEFWTAEGPMSDSGRMHGKWTFWNLRNDARTQPKWYWYGEEITEGEWHLRNK